ncbi:uncharacterized protein LOC129794355 [Lutzomyia longipalpis]|uniref:uncharacterized protein LOC129794355 n=1 Tax=Lutzomyia longipalpis TaxID=7200 RepID=UPI0024841311|nr:uncharacterized protein LOC129794355 [Lutzomyia longipalpis]
MSLQVKHLCVLIILWISLINADDDPATTAAPVTPGICITPEGQAGVCVDIKECAHLLNILTKTPLSDEDTKYLQERQCGFVNGTATVCCDVEEKREKRSVNSLLPNPYEGKCGAQTTFNRLIGGEFAKIDEYTWMTRLKYKSPEKEPRFLCGGSLINDRYVLTVAHCVRAGRDWELYQVRIGEYNTSTDPDCEEDDCAPAVKDIAIEEQIIHPNYNLKTRTGDIALLRLEEAVQFNDFVQPICLPIADNLKISSFDGKTLHVTGWGTAGGALGAAPTEVKQNVRVQAISLERCNEIYKPYKVVLGQEHLCAHEKNPSENCKGDSGGPLMIQNAKSGRGQWYCVGLLSFGARCGAQDYPEVYTRVSEYVDWISQTVRAFTGETFFMVFPLFFFLKNKSININIILCVPKDPKMSVQIKYLCGLIILWMSVVKADYSEVFGYCELPEGGQGTCVKLHECKALYDILANKRPLTESDKQYLRERQCGYFDPTVAVCCAVEISSNSNFNNNLLPDPEQGMCGIDTSNRIYGGEITKIDEYPWMTLLRYKKPGNRFGFHCGGVLINNRYVMTASHCVNGRDIPVDWTLYQCRLGEHDTTKDPDCEEDDCAPTPKDILIAERIPHPNYNPTSRNQRNDIALLRLSTTVQFNDFIKPVCLPSAAHLRTSTFVGQSMDVAGWGKTESVSASNVKLKVRVNGVSQESCNAIYNRQNVIIGEGQLCAGGEKGRDSCRGDSGGPLVALDNKSGRPYWYCVGLVSFGPSPCGLEGWPGVYTRVSEYIDWISQTVRA